MKIVFTLLLVLIINELHAQQYSSHCLNGSWKIIDAYSKEDDESFAVYKENNVLSISFQDGKISYSIGKFGFVDTTQIEGQNIKLEDIRSVGNYFIHYEETDTIKNKVVDFMILDHFHINKDCDDMSFGNAKVYDGRRIEKIPFTYIKALSPQALNYFFKIKIIKKKTQINQAYTEASKVHLSKNDLVEVLEEKGKWLRIKYYLEKDEESPEKTAEGWIKKSNVN